MYAVELQGITKSYKKLHLLQGLDLAIDPDTFNVVFGGPASGKSVLLRLIMGLEKPDAGQIIIRGENAESMLPSERNIGYIPQSFALYPHYSVYDNIAYPLTLAGASKEQIEPKVLNAAELLKIPHLLTKKPNQLSGGEKQRVAIARGIVKETELFIFDDPLTGLDFKLREQLFDDFKRLRETLNATFIYTTSDALEALMMGERIATLVDGQITEQGITEQGYYEPTHAKTLYSLGFPPATLMEAELETNGGGIMCHTQLFDFPVTMLNGANVPAKAQVGIRPQHLLLNERPEGACLSTSAQILLQEDLGSEFVIYLDKDGFTFESVLPHEKDHLLEGFSEIIEVNVSPESLLVFDLESGMKIGQGTV